MWGFRGAGLPLIVRSFSRQSRTIDDIYIFVGSVVECAYIGLYGAKQPANSLNSGLLPNLPDYERKPCMTGLRVLRKIANKDAGLGLGAQRRCCSCTRSKGLIARSITLFSTKRCLPSIWHVNRVFILLNLRRTSTYCHCLGLLTVTASLDPLTTTTFKAYHGATR